VKIQRPDSAGLKEIDRKEMAEKKRLMEHRREMQLANRMMARMAEGGSGGRVIGADAAKVWVATLRASSEKRAEKAGDDMKAGFRVAESVPEVRKMARVRKRMLEQLEGMLDEMDVRVGEGRGGVRMMPFSYDNEFTRLERLLCSYVPRLAAMNDGMNRLQRAKTGGSWQEQWQAKQTDKQISQCFHMLSSSTPIVAGKGRGDPGGGKRNGARKFQFPDGSIIRNSRAEYERAKGRNDRRERVVRHNAKRGGSNSRGLACSEEYMSSSHDQIFSKYGGVSQDALDTHPHSPINMQAHRQNTWPPPSLLALGSSGLDGPSAQNMQEMHMQEQRRGDRWQASKGKQGPAPDAMADEDACAEEAAARLMEGMLEEGMQEEPEQQEPQQDCPPTLQGRYKQVEGQRVQRRQFQKLGSSKTSPQGAQRRLQVRLPKRPPAVMQRPMSAVAMHQIGSQHVVMMRGHGGVTARGPTQTGPVTKGGGVLRGVRSVVTSRRPVSGFASRREPSAELQRWGESANGSRRQRPSGAHTHTR
jgi:hypothetical protein